MILGFHCQDSSALSDEAVEVILQNIGIKGEGVP